MGIGRIAYRAHVNGAALHCAYLTNLSAECSHTAMLTHPLLLHPPRSSPLPLVQVPVEKCGYYEDRRPASNLDPYVVTRLIVETTLLDY